MKIKPNIDGLISRNVANFLLERQRQNDLIGYAVFGNVKAAALEAAEAADRAENLAQGKIHNDSLLRFRGEDRGASTDLIGAIERRPGSRGEEMRNLTETTEEGRLWVLGLMRQIQATSAGRCGLVIWWPYWHAGFGRSRARDTPTPRPI